MINHSKNKQAKVFVAMSGGVDSSAVAGIMKEGSGTQYSIMISGMRGYR